MSYGTHAKHGDTTRREAQYNAALSGAARGASLGLATSLPTAYILNQRWGSFRALSLPIKAFFVTSATIAAGVIAADKSGIAFDQEHYTDRGATELRKHQTREEEEWSQLTMTDKALTWAKDNKFGVVAGSWVASMGGIFAYIHTQPMSFSQKLVQTRVWAQGLTLASLLGMAAITQIPTAGDKILKARGEAHEHSWRDFVGEQESGIGARQASTRERMGKGADGKPRGSEDHRQELEAKKRE